MEALILIVLIFFFGIGFVFEVIGFVFRILFSSLGVVLGLIVAAAVAIVAVPLVMGFIGFIIPNGLVILGIIFLIALVSNRTKRCNRRDYRYNRQDRDYYRS